jgi:glycosyltransferase involved in cell wall biosynthesis
MKILHLCGYSGNLGDYVRVRKIHEYLVSRGHAAAMLNMVKERYPLRKLLARPDIVKMFLTEKIRLKNMQIVKNILRAKLAAEILDKKLHAFKPDLVLCEGIFWAYVATRAINVEVPIIVDVHSVMSAELEGWNDQEVVDQAKAFEREVFHRSSEVIVISNLMREYLAETYKVGSEKLHVIPNGSDPRNRIARYNEPIRAIYAGNFSHWENVDSFLDMAKLDQGYAYYIAGNGPLRPHVLKRARSMRVNYLGYLGYEQSIAALADMTVGIAPAVRSKNIEMAYPIKVFDYLSCGLPVITPNYGEWSRLVMQSNCGLVTDESSGESFVACLRSLDKSIWSEMSANGVRLVRDRFNWELLLCELDRII